MPESDSGGHALLAPSAAHRWITCPASVRMGREVDLPPEPSNFYAEEGTAAHALGEIEARFALLLPPGPPSAYQAALYKWRTTWEHVITDETEMRAYVLGYVDYLRQALAEEPGSVLLLEQRVPSGHPSCWGTADALLVSPRRVRAVDLKYGQGVRVEAEGNEQTRIYGIGALEAFGDLLGEVETVAMTIYQPRLDHVATEELTAAELRAWRDDVMLPAAELALTHDAPFGPSDEACRWCPASGQCVAQYKHAVLMDFGTVAETISDEELADVLDRLPQIEAWCAAVRDYALRRVFSDGATVPGYKVVQSRGQRYVADPEGAIEALEMIGFELNQIVNTKVKGIGDLEKLLGKKGMRLLDPYIAKTEGAPSLVSEADNRQPINSLTRAVEDFS